MTLRLSKSDFKACADCKTRLFYRKNKYPSTQDDNLYLQLLADGGFMVEFIAKAQFPTGIDLADMRDAEAAFSRTKELLAQDGAVIFEAAALHERYYVRTDILVRRGNHLDLIEVKSSGLNSGAEAEPFRNQKGGIIPKWRNYLTDLAFQTMVVRAAFPHLTVTPWLCVINKAHRAGLHETLDLFRLQRPDGTPRGRPEVTYNGHTSALKGTHLLTRRDATAEVEELIPSVLHTASSLVGLLGVTEVQRVHEDISTHYKICRTCEYRVGPEISKNGFRECWGTLADARPHLLDLHRVGQVGRKDEPDPVTALLIRGVASLDGFAENDLAGEGTYAQRRLLQWQHSMGEGSEHLPDELTQELSTHREHPGYPLHFIDFEACNLTLPPHAGLRPYERVAFQWSCHTLDSAGNLSHKEWLNTGREIPNFIFAQTLRDVLGETGTVYVWSPYEQSTLNHIRKQITDWIAFDAPAALAASGLKTIKELDDLADWIDRLLGPTNGEEKRISPRIRDLHDLALKHYFHPKMGGRTSIKVVLPSVWTVNERIRQHPWFTEYAHDGENGLPLDPYKTLPALPLGEDEEEDVVQEGTGAVRVYQDLIFNSDHSEIIHAQRRKLLLQYCKLDTAAMVMIWAHWTGFVNR